jgi:hypothetical protein
MWSIWEVVLGTWPLPFECGMLIQPAGRRALCQNRLVKLGVQITELEYNSFFSHIRAGIYLRRRQVYAPRHLNPLLRIRFAQRIMKGGLSLQTKEYVTQLSRVREAQAKG